MPSSTPGQNTSGLRACHERLPWETNMTRTTLAIRLLLLIHFFYMALWLPVRQILSGRQEVVAETWYCPSCRLHFDVTGVVNEWLCPICRDEPNSLHVLAIGERERCHRTYRGGGMRVVSRIYEALGRANLLGMALTLSDPTINPTRFARLTSAMHPEPEWLEFVEEHPMSRVIGYAEPC